MEKKPFLTEAQAQEILQDVPTPFHVYDEKGIRENARRLNKALQLESRASGSISPSRRLPTPAILQILKEEGCGVDCSSLTELMLSEALRLHRRATSCSPPTRPRRRSMKMADRAGRHTSTWMTATMVDFLDRAGRCAGEHLLPLQSRRHVHRWARREEGFQVMDKPGDAKYGMTRGADDRELQEADAEGRKELRHPRLPGLQHHLQRLLSGAGRHPVPAGGPSCRRPPVRTSPSSTCPAAWASPTAPTRPRTTSSPSARASARGL